MTSRDEADLTPRRVVEELDRYIVGQDDAKRAVAIAIRNRWRRRQLPPEMRDEVAPKNILMIGPTGVGKTEIARRLAQLVRAPFLKVEASKYTEVGYVGRDVESMVRDLVEVAVNQARTDESARVRRDAERAAEKRLLDLLCPEPDDVDARVEYRKEKQRLRRMLRDGVLEEREVEIEVETRAAPQMHVFGPAGIEHLGFDIQSLFDRLGPTERRRKRMSVGEARKVLVQRTVEEMLDLEKVRREGLRRVQEAGIIFIDEVDKIAGREKGGGGPDVSREGVQRDLLPILEGTTVLTRHGPVSTQHILFVGAGAFNVARPSELIPELQGRFPIRVELSALGEEEFYRIMTEPRNALTKQYAALLATEGVKVVFAESALHEMARVASEVNRKTQNIGARRLFTVFEKLLEEVLFEAPDMAGQTVTIDADYVRGRLARIAEDVDTSRYIL